MPKVGGVPLTCEANEPFAFILRAIVTQELHHVKQFLGSLARHTRIETGSFLMENLYTEGVLCSGGILKSDDCVHNRMCPRLLYHLDEQSASRPEAIMYGRM